MRAADQEDFELIEAVLALAEEADAIIADQGTETPTRRTLRVRGVSGSRSWRWRRGCRDRCPRRDTPGREADATVEFGSYRRERVKNALWPATHKLLPEELLIILCNC
jgi:hypothetical protein